MKSSVAFFLSFLFSLAMAHNSLGYGVNAVFFDSGATLEIEVAETPSQLQTGLMYRDNLPEGNGELFIFDSEERHSFWMKNMNFPIDIIWMDSNLNIVDITREAVPCQKEQCPIYSPSAPARYVLEVPSGYTQEKGVAIGQHVVLKDGGEE